MPIAFVALSVVVDAMLTAYLVTLNLRFKHLYKRKYDLLCRSLYIMVTILVQQTLLLLKMFTFFHELRFIYVFSPVMVLAVVAVVDVTIQYKRYFRELVACRSLGMGALGVFVVVLLAFKVDSLFGLSTEVNLDVNLDGYYVNYDWVLIFLVGLFCPVVLCFICLLFDGITACVLNALGCKW